MYFLYSDVETENISQLLDSDNENLFLWCGLLFSSMSILLDSNGSCTKLSPLFLWTKKHNTWYNCAWSNRRGESLWRYHRKHDVTIIQYIAYSMLIGSEYRTLVCVLRCDIALAGLGYITSSDTKLRSYILYIGLISILYIYIYIYNHIYIYIYIYIYLIMRFIAHTFLWRVSLHFSYKPQNRLIF